MQTENGWIFGDGYPCLKSFRAVANIPCQRGFHGWRSKVKGATVDAVVKAKESLHRCNGRSTDGGIEEENRRSVPWID
jgi:hypothetical protein